MVLLTIDATKSEGDDKIVGERNETILLSQRVTTTLEGVIGGSPSLQRLL